MSQAFVGCGGSTQNEACSNVVEQSCVCAPGVPGVVEICDGVERTACMCDRSTDAGMLDGSNGGHVVVDAAADGGVDDRPGRACLGDGQGACAIAGVAAGRGHTCVWRAAGEIDCFGDNTFKQLGWLSELDGARDGTGEDRSFDDVRAVEGIVGDVVEVATGGDYACARTQQGEVWCWGLLAPIAEAGSASGSTNSSNAGTAPSLPSHVVGLTDVTSLVVGRGHACAATASRGTSCWGDNSAGQLGLGTELAGKLYLPQPKRIRIVEADIEALALGRGFSCAIVNARVLCWGQGDRGQLGDGRAHPNPSQAAVSVAFPRDVKVRALVAGEAHACALVESGAVWCWGDNTHGQLGLDSAIEMRAEPALVLDARTQKALSLTRSLTAGADHACGIDRAGSVHCWGSAEALCGEDPGKPVAARAFYWYGLSARQVVAGDHHTCALRPDGRVHCLGANDTGQSMPTALGEVCEHDEPVDVVP
ncbi:MAG: hypothetical protein H6729_16495 [Deltaproteobacteria bacterium]|nr:hypothetical protein [Deltaproteobacteria bacterium]